MSGGYTPGPWHTGADGRIVYNAAGWAVCNAVTFHQRHQGDEDRANARLIAAAPELFDVANDALDAMLTLDDGALGYADGPMDAEGKGYTYPIKDELIAKLTAAIAKAKGGAA